MRKSVPALFMAAAFTAGTPVFAGEADVIDVRVELESSGAFTFHVTVRHEDAGWDHYADRWDVVGDAGAVLGERILLHPHENEQPFTRSKSGVVVPPQVREVVVRAHDKVHGLGGKTIRVSLPGRN